MVDVADNGRGLGIGFLLLRFDGTVELDVSPDILRRQLTIIGSWTFSSTGQADCARYVVERDIDIDQLFTHRFTLDQAHEAHDTFDQQTTGKGVFEF